MNRISNLIIAPVLLLALGCVGPAIQQTEPEEGQPGWQDPRGFDPLELPLDRKVIPEEQPQAGAIIGRQELVVRDSAGGAVDSAAAVDHPPSFDSTTNQAFRVQLFTSKLFSEARRAVRVAEEIFDQPVFMDYEVPYFKVRVGSFAEREPAEEYELRARGAGYSNAWVVLVNVNVREAAPLYDDLPGVVPGDSLPPQPQPTPGPPEE